MRVRITKGSSWYEKFVGDAYELINVDTSSSCFIVKTWRETETDIILDPLPVRFEDSEVVEEGVSEISFLKDKHRLFCYYYLTGHSATQSAIKAGYSEKSAHVTGHRLAKKPQIAKVINKVKLDFHNFIADKLDIGFCFEDESLYLERDYFVKAMDELIEATEEPVIDIITGESLI
ncbi:terminase small subunit [Bacillus velezensis]|uniref:terminase small subunit n=1 Tax=Bacillus velezensis TaxID=492670 RepID=UPI00145C2694|nr:terminase small subunit [Bacillus velezensis]MCA1233285.1 terminase small subunit [Bacillus velezensis]MCA1311385.1 terminase small subunit [Bacillus velezensis]MCA1330378.1 terminase small subunit [Bacillus velezensis]NMP63628.1 terminase small subunit [Bacillus velezensis]